MFGMTKEELARRLAKESRISTAAAADHLDRTISEILARVRKGQSAALPGFGTFRPGRGPRLRFDLGIHALPDQAERPKTGKEPR
jgi:nucleoid DNA-binding protein